MNRHTTIVNIYLEQKATRAEIYTFIQTINKRLASGFPGDTSVNPYGEDLKDDIFNNEKDPLNPDNLSQEVIQNIVNGATLTAVKLHKDNTGLGLKDAKDCIDKYLQLNNLRRSWQP